MSAASPRLSVVVPTYGAPALLAQTLRSLASQDYDAADVEIVVVDDGSPDFEPSGWGDLAAPIRLELRHFESNRGRAAARNAGIRLARGEIVVFLDGDMTVAPGFLRAHDGFHRGWVNAAAVGAIRWGDDVPDTSLTRYLASRGVARYTAGPVPFKCFVTGNSSVPRSRLVDIGLFDEGFSGYGGEDLDLGYRLHRTGTTVHFAPQALSVHHQARPLGDMCLAMRIYGRQSLPRLMERHPELAVLLRLDFLRLPRLHPRRLALRAALAHWIYAAVRCLAQWTTRRKTPPLVYDYLWWYERTRGYLESTR